MENKERLSPKQQLYPHEFCLYIEPGTTVADARSELTRMGFLNANYIFDKHFSDKEKIDSGLDLLVEDKHLTYYNTDEIDNIIERKIMYGEIEETNSDLSLSQIIEEFNQQEKLNIKFVDNPSHIFYLDNPSLTYLNKQTLSEEVCFIALQQDLANFEHIPKKFLSSRITDFALTADGNLIIHIPNPTPDTIDKALQTTPTAIQYLGWGDRTFDRCEKAALKEFAALEFMPEYYRTEEVCRKVLDAHKDRITSSDVGILCKTPYYNLILEAATASKQNYDRSIEYTQKGQWTDNYIYLPASLRTNELNTEQIKREPLSYNKLTYEEKTADLTLLATISSKPHLRSQLRVPGDMNEKVKEISDVHNVYDFYKLLRNGSKTEFSFEDTQNMYRGSTIVVKNLHLPNGIVKNAALRYDKDINRIKIEDLTESKPKVQRNKKNVVQTKQTSIKKKM